MASTGMAVVPGGALLMGSEGFYPEEGPVHERSVEPFELDVHPVTNGQFAEFVEATGHVTVAEQALDPANFPGADPATLVPGGLVFTATDGPVDLRNWRAWWRWVPGASWRHPQGPQSGVDHLPHHPVVQVAHPDALAYAAWAGKRLPTEAEWEHAARGALVGATYAWGDELHPGGRLLANTWQGDFPHRNEGALGWSGTSPVGTFPAGDHGLFDMIGNVWEWTSDVWSARHVPPGQTGPTAGDRRRLPLLTDPSRPRRVLKGGSHLCAPEYCRRYRPAARSAQAWDTATTHIGFRCARDGTADS